ncbi:MAG: hypothetical protein WA840_19755 [Caulobacteraceae bacterium]
MRAAERFDAPSGRFRLWTWRRGVLMEVTDEANLIVSNSQQIHAQLLGGQVANNSVTQIAYGTGTAPAAVGNTVITNPFAKPLDSVAFPASNQVQFNFSLASTEDNGVAISEFGLLTAGGVLYARKVRTAPLNKDTDLSFTGSWTISF